jgi:hypothetical protein
MDNFYNGLLNRFFLRNTPSVTKELTPIEILRNNKKMTYIYIVYHDIR